MFGRIIQVTLTPDHKVIVTLNPPTEELQADITKTMKSLWPRRDRKGFPTQEHLAVMQATKPEEVQYDLGNPHLITELSLRNWSSMITRHLADRDAARALDARQHAAPPSASITPHWAHPTG